MRICIAIFALTSFLFGGESVKKDMKEAAKKTGDAIEDAAKTTGRATKKAARKVKHKTKKTVNKGAGKAEEKTRP